MLKMRMILIFFSSLCTRDAIPYKSSCIKEHCNGPFTLTNYTIHTHEKKADVTGLIVEIKDAATKTTIEKKMSKYYFYNGGAVDPNSRVEVTKKTFQATREELEMPGCHIGKSYAPQQAWGSDARACIGEQPLDQFVKDRDGKYLNYNAEYGDAPFANHMCVIDWKCKTHRGPIPVHLAMEYTQEEDKPASDIELAIETYGMKGEKIKLCVMKIGSSPERCETTVHDGDFTSLIKYDKDEVSRKVEVVCFHHEKKSSMCKEVDNPDIYEMVCSPKICVGVSSLKALVITNEEMESSTITEKIKLPGISASILDLVLTQRQIMYYAENTNYNLETIQYDLYSIYRIVNKMALSLGKLDDELLPNLMDRTGKTTWLTPEMFNICPCYNVKMPEGHNCGNDHIYDNGRVKKIESKKEKEKCVNFKKEAASNVDIFKNKDIAINELEFEPPNGTSADWEGWTWISETKMQEIENMGFISKINNDSNPFYDIFNNIDTSFGFWGKLKFILSTSFLTYLNTAVLLYLVIKRR